MLLPCEMQSQRRVPPRAGSGARNNDRSQHGLRDADTGTRAFPKAAGASSARGVGGIKSINKAVAIVREIHAASRPLRVSELSKLLDLSPSVVSRIVSTLMKGGMLDHDEETNRIQLGLGLAVLGHSALGRRKLDLIAIPVMAKLSEDFKEYISLSRLVEGRVAMVRGGPVEVMHQHTFLTAVVPVHASAPGKLLAAWLPEERLLELLELRGMDAYTPTTITSVRQFKDELRKIRKERFALDDEERGAGLPSCRGAHFRRERQRRGRLVGRRPDSEVERRRDRDPSRRPHQCRHPDLAADGISDRCTETVGRRKDHHHICDIGLFPRIQV